MEGRVHPDARVPELLVEQLALGVLSPPADRALRQRLRDAGVDVDARLQALREASERELRRHPPARARRVIERRVDARRRRRRRARAWVSGAALTAAATALLWFPVTSPETAPSGAPEDDPGRATMGVSVTAPLRPDHAAEASSRELEESQTKGLHPRLLIHRKRDDQIERLEDGDLARAGDRVQLSYIAAGRRRGVIVSYDGRGKVTLHFPDTALARPQLHGGGAVPLGHSFELDDAPGFERFVFVTAPADDEGAFDVERVLAAARAVTEGVGGPSIPLALPDGWEQTAFELVKVER